MAAVAVRVALMAAHVKQLRLMAMAQGVVAHCLVVEAEGQQVVVRAVVALVAQSVLFTPVTYVNSRQQTYPTRSNSPV
jgi:hypothetical protein